MINSAMCRLPFAGRAASPYRRRVREASRSSRRVLTLARPRPAVVPSCSSISKPFALRHLFRALGRTTDRPWGGVVVAVVGLVETPGPPVLGKGQGHDHPDPTVVGPSMPSRAARHRRRPFRRTASGPAPSRRSPLAPPGPPRIAARRRRGLVVLPFAAAACGSAPARRRTPRANPRRSACSRPPSLTDAFTSWATTSPPPTPT